MTQRKYSSYKTLESALRRDKFEKSGVLASALLNIFMLNNDELRAAHFFAKGLCVVGTFTCLRKTLIEKGWLVWSDLQINKSKYSPGRKLIRFINLEKLATNQLVSTDQIIPKAELQRELSTTKLRLAKVEKRLDQVEKITKELIEVVGPPDTATRVRKRISLASQLTKATGLQ